MKEIFNIIAENIFIIVLLLGGAISQWLKSRGEAKEIPTFDPRDLNEDLDDSEPARPRQSVPPRIPFPVNPTPQLQRSVVLEEKKAQVAAHSEPYEVNTAAEMSRQIQLTEQINELKRKKTSRHGNPFPAQHAQKSLYSKALGDVRGSIFDRAELRKTLLLKEILDKPVALR